MVRQGRLARIMVNLIDQGTARTQSPTTKNYTPELSTFGIIARVSPGPSAMTRPRPGGTSLVIKVASEPGKYAFPRFWNPI